MPVMRQKLPRLHCFRCHEEWWSRKPSHSDQCPRCGSIWWDTPYTLAYLGRMPTENIRALLRCDLCRGIHEELYDSSVIRALRRIVEWEEARGEKRSSVSAGIDDIAT